METKPTELMLDVHKLRIGMFVYLDLGWMDHPFPLNRFKISTNAQIEQIKGLRLKQVKVMTALSDPASLLDEDSSLGDQPAAPAVLSTEELAAKQAAEAIQARRRSLAQQNADLARCEREFSTASGAWKQVAALAQQDAAKAREQSEALVKGLLDQITATRESNIRLLSETAGDGVADIGALAGGGAARGDLAAAVAERLEDDALADEDAEGVAALALVETAAAALVERIEVGLGVVVEQAGVGGRAVGVVDEPGEELAAEKAPVGQLLVEREAGRALLGLSGLGDLIAQRGLAAAALSLFGHVIFFLSAKAERLRSGRGGRQAAAEQLDLVEDARAGAQADEALEQLGRRSRALEGGPD